jgi:hypothetical protein
VEISGARSAQIRDLTKCRRNFARNRGTREGEREEGKRNFSSKNPCKFELSKSLKCKECGGDRSHYEANLRRNKTLRKCERDPRKGLIGRTRVETFEPFENIPSLKKA